MNFYLLGYPVGHSVSPLMHNTAFNELGMSHRYSLLDVHPYKLSEIIDSKIRVDSFGGANVTIPHKITIMKYMDELAESANKAGAVNTLEYRDGVVCGHNTDAMGGVRALEEAYGSLSNVSLVLLGAGGAANALATEFVSKVKEITILNRSVERAKTLSYRLGEKAGYGSLSEDLAVIESADILVNATSLGMAPKTNESPVDPSLLHPGLLVYDIIYNPLKTRLILDAEKIGAKTLGGLWMLVYQGVEAFKIWTGIEPSAQTMYEAALEALETLRH